MVGARGQRFGAQKRLESRKRILMLVPYITLGAHAGAGSYGANSYASMLKHA